MNALRDHKNFGKAKNPDNQSWVDLLSHIPWVDDGIYFVLASGTPIYIGTSTMPRYRLIGHNRRKDFIALGADLVEFSHTTVGKFARGRIERKLIQKYEPVLNKTYRSKKGAK